MQIVYLVGAILAIALQNALRKQYNTGGNSTAPEKKGTFIFSAVSCFAALVFFLISSGFKLTFVPELIPYALGFAASYGTAVIFGFLAIKHGSLSLSSLISSYSLIIPTVFGILFLGEKTTVTFYIGLAVLCISLFLINSKKSDDGIKITPKWILFVVLGFVGNGVCSAVQALQQRAFGGLYKSELMIIALSAVVLTLLTISFITERELILPSIKYGGIYMVSNGLSNGVCNLFIMLAVGLMNAALMYPLISAGGIICTTLISIFVYKEKFTTKQYVAFAFGILAVILLNV